MRTFSIICRAKQVTRFLMAQQHEEKERKKHQMYFNLFRPGFDDDDLVIQSIKINNFNFVLNDSIRVLQNPVNIASVALIV